MLVFVGICWYLLVSRGGGSVSEYETVDIDGSIG
jgi:hypothetical protein